MKTISLSEDIFSSQSTKNEIVFTHMKTISFLKLMT